MNTFSRSDFKQIANWIPHKASVLDLGCGDGYLLKGLKETHQISGYGIEKNDAQWLKALQNGINVIQMDLEAGLSGFETQSFDIVVLSQTLQAVLNTEEILKEILRVGKQAIVSFPNFAYWQNRLYLLTGRMPISNDLPYQWFDTPNIHLCTLKDFERLCQKNHILIQERLVFTQQKIVNIWPNLFGSLAIYRLEGEKIYSKR